MENNILANPFINYTQIDVSFELTITKAIADNVNLSAIRRRDAFNKIVQLEEVLSLFAIADETGLQYSGTGISVVGAITGKSYEQLVKESTPSMARDTKDVVMKGVDSAANAGRSAARTLGNWLTKVGQEK